MGGVGGGGTSGAMSLPYSSSVISPNGQYTSWICDDLDGMINAAEAAATPYNGETTPDPDDLMDVTAATRTQYEVSDQFTLVEAIDVDGDIRGFIEEMVAEVDEADTFPSITTDVAAIHTAERTSISSAMTAALTAAATAVAATPIADMVTAYEARIKKQYLRGMARHASYMADIGAVNSTAFAFGMAAIERDMLDNVDFYDASLDLETYKQHISTYIQAFNSTFSAHLSGYMTRKSHRDQAIMYGTGEMTQLYMNKINANYNATHLQAEVNRIRHVAKVEEHQNQLDLDVKDSLWDFELHTFGANMLAAAGGAAVVPPQMSKMSSAIGGAMAGGALGSVAMPGVGTIVGGAVGLIAGIFS